MMCIRQYKNRNDTHYKHTQHTHSLTERQIQTSQWADTHLTTGLCHWDVSISIDYHIKPKTNNSFFVLPIRISHDFDL